MKIFVEPCLLKGKISAPPSKSYSHRILLCASIPRGTIVVHGISKSVDMIATMECIKAFTSKEAFAQADKVTVFGQGKEAFNCYNYNCHESGSTLRFFIPLSLYGGNPATFTAAPRLIERGIGIYEDLFVKKNISVKINRETNQIQLNGKLTSGKYELPGNVSSQFVTGLLFALPLLDGDSVIKIIPPLESRSYINITIDVMKLFGIKVQVSDDGLEYFIPGNQKYVSEDHDIYVEGDWSNATPLLAFNNFGANLDVTGLNYNSCQGDKICVEYLKLLESENARIDLQDCPDLGPVLMAVAAASGNGAEFINTRRLRIKESDRAQAMKDELLKFGIKVDVNENDVVIHKGKLQKPCCELDSHNDHRIVMAMTLLCSLPGMGGVINQAESICKSYPDFFIELSKVGLSAKAVDSESNALLNQIELYDYLSTLKT